MARRDKVINVRTTPGEKAEIARRAGGPRRMSEYLRRLGLGDAVAAAPPAPAARATPAEVDAERVAAEVDEAKLADDAAREAFVARRTRELVGKGRTTPVARREAEAEWRAR